MATPVGVKLINNVAKEDREKLKMRTGIVPYAKICVIRFSFKYCCCVVSELVSE